MGRMAVAAAACAAILLAGCGGGDGSSGELASLAPPDAPLYLESVIRPEGAQKDAIDSLASRVGGIQDPGAAIVSQLDAGLSQSGADITYQNNIAPWLGQRASIFFQSFSGDPPDFAVAFESTDSGAARDFLDKVADATPDIQHENYNGVDYVQEPDSPYVAGIVGDFLVFGSIEAFKAAVDASDGSSLADSSEFEDGVSAVSSDNVGLGYVDSSQAIAAATAAMNPLEAQVVKPLLGTLASGPATFSASATTDTASVDVSLPSGSVSQPAAGDLLGKAPADAWFAVGVQGLGKTIGDALDAAGSIPGVGAIESRLRAETGLDPKDVLSWVEDGYAFVSGTSEKTIAIGAIVQSSDTQVSSEAISTLKKKFQADVDSKLGPPLLQGADAGFSAAPPESPQGIEVGQVGDQVVAALGPDPPAENALHPASTLADDPSFKAGEDALGSGFSPLAFVALDPFFVVAEKGGQANDPGYLAAKPYLQKLDYLLVGTSDDDGRTTARFVVGVK